MRGGSGTAGVGAAESAGGRTAGRRLARTCSSRCRGVVGKRFFVFPLCVGARVESSPRGRGASNLEGILSIYTINLNVHLHASSY